MLPLAVELLGWRHSASVKPNTITTMTNEESDGPDEPTFADLPLAPEVQEAIEAIGYETPSPIQAQAIPHLLAGRDLLLTLMRQPAVARAKQAGEVKPLSGVFARGLAAL